MKPIRHVVAIAIFLFQGSALAQTWPEEVAARRTAAEAFEENLGIDAASVESGAPLNDLRSMIGEGEDPGAWATFGPPAPSDRRGRWLRDLLNDVARLNRLSVEFRSFRFAPLEEPWARRDILERSADLENVAGDVFRSITGHDPETFEYDRAQFTARRLDERLVMIGVLAGRTGSDILQTVRADVIDVARQTTIASRLNILWELGRNLEIPQ